MYETQSFTSPLEDFFLNCIAFVVVVFVLVLAIALDRWHRERRLRKEDHERFYELSTRHYALSQEFRIKYGSRDPVFPRAAVWWLARTEPKLKDIGAPFHSPDEYRNLEEAIRTISELLAERALLDRSRTGFGG